MGVLTFLLSLVAVQAATIQGKEQMSENPIRRIVNLLQMMAKEVEEDGEKDEEMHEKYLCYCETNEKKLSDSVAALEEKIPQIEASIKEAVSTKEQLVADLAKHKKDREDAKAAIDTATEQREKEKGAFDAESTEAKANIAACTKAVAAIEKGMSGSFLQSETAGALRKLVNTRESMDQYARDMLTEFLSTSSGYAPASGEIVGILKQLLEDMEKELVDMTSEESAAVAEFEALVNAKEKEIQAATEAIESKTARNGEVAVKIVNLKNDLSDAQDALGEDQKFAAELKKGCANAEGEYQERKKGRAQESVAISETIKILNDDDALDLFKKTLPSPSLLQMTSESQLRDEALSAFQDLSDNVVKSQPRLGMIQLALMGKKVSFDKIIKMIDDLTAVLKDEQKEDEKQKEWCEAEFDKSEDKDGELSRKIAGLESAIGEMTEGVATLTDDIKALTDGITALDKSVAEATATRKEENAEFTTVAAQNNAAVQLLGVAENRLNKFYNPAAYKAPQRRELTEEERIYVQSGGADPRDAEEAAAAQTGIAGTGITAFSQGAPPPPPATAGAYKKKDAGGPTALIKKLTQDLKMEMQANEIDEKNAQEDYEELMADSAKKRAGDSKTITEKESQKAGLEGDLEQATKDHKAASAEKLALGEYVAQLHSSCDFLLKNFDLRREARSNEIDAMQKAKAVLGGADYSFVQVSSFLQRKPRQHKAAHFRPPRSSGRHPFAFNLSPRVH